MNSTDPIVAAAQRLARTLFPEPAALGLHITQVGAVSRQTGCDTIATEHGFNIRTDRQDPHSKHAPEIYAARAYHAAAHMLCIQDGTPSHSGSGRHTKAFTRALERLGCGPEGGTLPKLTKAQRTAAVGFAQTVVAAISQREKRQQAAYQRGTVACLHEGCSHTITLRLTTIAKTRFLCAEHGEEMHLLD